MIHLEAQEPQQPAARPGYTYDQPQQPQRQSTDDRVRDAIRSAPQPAPAAAPRRAPDMPAQRQLSEPASDNGPLYTALCAAIRTAAAAEAFAASIGHPVAFDTGDIRAMAATLFIHQTGGGVR